MSGLRAHEQRRRRRDEGCRASHGGFYKQFASKEDLIDEAAAHAFAKPAVYSAAVPEEHAGEFEAARRTLTEQYLSVWHRDHAGDGCLCPDSPPTWGASQTRPPEPTSSTARG